MCLNLHDHQASRYSYGSTDLNIMVTTNQKHATDSHTHTLNRTQAYYYYYYIASVVSDSMRPNGRQPTRLPCPWDSPGENTGVGCHVLLQCMKVKSLSHVQLFATPWTAAYQVPPSIGFSRQEYWSGVPSPSPPDPATGS